MKRYFFLLLFTALSLTNQAQIMNADFENWYTDTEGKQRLTGWENLSQIDMPNSLLQGTWQNNNSQHNTYALTLSRWYNYTWDNIRQSAAISIRPLYLEGYYKYTKTDLTGTKSKDTALVEIILTAWNTALNKQDTIGIGKQRLSAVADYTLFSCPVNYILPASPDSFMIHIEPSIWRGTGAVCADSSYCSFLSIDNLSFSAISAVTEIQNSVVSIYPNPINDILFIRQSDLLIKRTVTIQNVMGQVVFEGPLSEVITVIDAAQWRSGFYAIKVQAKNSSTTITKLIKEQ